LSVWREARVYDERERVALELTEAVTRVDVGDDLWERARGVFGEDELAQVVVRDHRHQLVEPPVHDHARRARALRGGDVRLTERFLAARPGCCCGSPTASSATWPRPKDVVQEARLRLQRAGPETIEDLDAWADDHGRPAGARRPALGPRAAACPTSGRGCPSRCSATRSRRCASTLDESVSYALLTVLERLTPAERTAVRAARRLRRAVLGEVASIVGRSPESVRASWPRGRAGTSSPGARRGRCRPKSTGGW
jgi:hypothetical protein